MLQLFCICCSSVAAVAAVYILRHIYIYYTLYITINLLIYYYMPLIYYYMSVIYYDISIYTELYMLL